MTDPDIAVRRAAAAAIRAAEASLAADGATLEHLFLTLHAADVPAGELDACTAGRGFDDDRDLLARLLSVCRSMGGTLGIKIRLLPTEEIGRG